MAPDGIPSLLTALETWSDSAAILESLAARLERGELDQTIDLRLDDLAAPLPRSPQFLDGSVYLHHMAKARAARGASMPSNHTTEPLMYQGMSDQFIGPTQPMRLPSEDDGIDYEAELGVVVDDVPLGTTAAEARTHIKLLVLFNDYTLRALTQHELPRGFGFLQSKPTSSFAAVAVTPDELGPMWDGDRIHLRVQASVNDRLIGQPNAAEGMFFTYPQLIAHAARTRDLSAGTIIGAGSISNESPQAGHGCLAEARMADELAGAGHLTPWLAFGDRIRIEATDDDGRSVFGPIDQRIERQS